MLEIKKIHAREILDSRGNPTIEADVTLANGASGRAAVPSGASTGTREAIELRDNDKQRFLGKGVLSAVSHVNDEISRLLVGKDASDQRQIDNAMLDLDGTHNKSKLGANAILAVSLAIAKAVASARELHFFEYIAELAGNINLIMPVPQMNIINGGAHADNNLAIQEFMILPVGAPSFREALRYGAEVFHHLQRLLGENELNTAVGDEGGFAPNLPSHKIALDFILNAIEQAGFKPGKDIYLGLDVAASELHGDGIYYIPAEDLQLSSEGFVDYLANLVDNYPIISIEDGMAENDWKGWELLTKRLGNKIQLVGDDVFVTNPQIFQEGIAKKIANAILIKLNQIGTLTETLTAIKMAKDANYGVVISHRSGETEDTTIADLSVGSGAGQIKTGSLCRTDRIAKYNQLLRLEEILGNSAVYSGTSILRVK